MATCAGGRLAVVLSSGGVGGIAHLGVLERLQQAGIRIDILIGSSAGALVAGYYAALGDPLPRLIEDAAETTPARLAAFALHIQGLPVPGRATGDHCRHLAARLAALDAVPFDALRGPVAALGVLAFDWTRFAPFFACTGCPRTGGLSVGRVVRGSASVPVLFPPVRLQTPGGRRWLSDGGLVRSLPLEWAFEPPLSATHALGVQLPTLRRHVDRRLPARRRLLRERRERILIVSLLLRVWRHALRGRSGLESLLEIGRRSIGEETLATLRRWRESPAPEGGILTGDGRKKCGS
jgi:predicted acylesterase/phospholipase RssA